LKILTMPKIGALALLLAAAAAQDAPAPAPSPAATTLPRLIDPNFASADELKALPHMTAERVAAILEKRPFAAMTEVHALIGAELTKEQRDDLYAAMFLPINLNTAPRDEILLIPGVGKRMAHEFEEYRPYKKIEQFRREIGKYVDAQEVARLERFVLVPLDLNTATEEQLKTIPGVGEKLASELVEYRPYKSLAQLRREIGKHVSDKEVARLEHYVFIE
jgi:DNA uptake protein ComE-like DNA-binding protein